MGSVLLFFYQKFIIFTTIICFSLYNYLLPLFFRKVKGAKNENSINWKISSKIDIESKSTNKCKKLTNEMPNVEETGISFQFKFRSYEEFCKKEIDNGANSSFEGSRGFIKEPEILEIENKNDEPVEDIEKVHDGVLLVKENFVQIDSEDVKDIVEEFENEINEKEISDVESVFLSPIGSFTNGLSYSSSDGVLSDAGIGDEFVLENEEELFNETAKLDEEEKKLGNEEDIFTMEEIKKFEDYYKNSVEDDIFTMEELIKLEDYYKNVGKFKLEIPSEKDVCGEIDLKKDDFENEVDLAKLDEKDTISDSEEIIYTVEELRKIGSHYKMVGKFRPKFLLEKGFYGGSEKVDSVNKSDLAKQDEKKTKLDSEEYKKEEARYRNVDTSKSEFANESVSKEVEKKSNSEWDLDELWEHQELSEQLKMEAKKAKATGLPTILESESLKIVGNLKPWIIHDVKFQQADRMVELHKFYKSYQDRMRKLDVLNFQKMYSIGFLQLKDPNHSISPEKYPIPSVSSFISHNTFPGKGKKIGNDPMMKFINELQSELEIVYVGHMCLSWEILHWQYGKALELWETDRRNICMYNEVAGHFQQFQVLLQRFIEDEPFQGPRVQNYVKSRCALRNLLQIPLIKEDNSKNKKKALKTEIYEFAITSDTLVEIFQESIRIFWRFVRADKDCSGVIKSRKVPSMKLQDPADSELLMEVLEIFHKEEKKLKNILKGRNCILKKFKMCDQDDETDHVLLFFSQVDMKLVGRVLNMPRITKDQLIWCRNKLQKISFISERKQVEPSFLLFPC